MSPGYSQLQLLLRERGYVSCRHPRGGWVLKKDDWSAKFPKLRDAIAFLEKQPVQRRLGVRVMRRIKGYGGWVDLRKIREGEL